MKFFFRTPALHLRASRCPPKTSPADPGPFRAVAPGRESASTSLMGMRTIAGSAIACCCCYPKCGYNTAAGNRSLPQPCTAAMIEAAAAIEAGIMGPAPGEAART